MGKIDLRYKRVSEYAELNKLERDILNLIDFGFFTHSDDEMTNEDKERDMIAKRRLRVTRLESLVDHAETIDNHIENVKNKSKKYITKGNDGVLIEINLNPEISNKQTVFKYNVLINDVENVLLIRDINTFLSSSFKLYKK